MNLNRDIIISGIIGLLILYVVIFIKNIVKGLFLIGFFVVVYLIYRNYYQEQFYYNDFEFNEDQENQLNDDPCRLPYNPTRGYELQ
jgi:hypothetical protein